LQPFAPRDVPALIESVFPAQKVSFEAQRERKAGAGQTPTALGSYWKGRKPLILVRVRLLGSLLPQTDDPEMDLEIFEKLMALDAGACEARYGKQCVQVRRDRAFAGAR
jgi:putative DNA methylase